MDLKKLSELEAEARSRLDLPPHEQDDPTVTYDPFSQLVGGVTGVNPNTTRTDSLAASSYGPGGYGVVTTAGSAIGQIPQVRQIPQHLFQAQQTPQHRLTIEGADPRVTKDGDDLMVVMDGGREMIFYNTGGPVTINGSERTFRLTKEQAKELAVKLVRMSMSET